MSRTHRRNPRARVAFRQNSPDRKAFVDQDERVARRAGGGVGRRQRRPDVTQQRVHVLRGRERVVCLFECVGLLG